jgi:hypothetical protein
MNLKDLQRTIYLYVRDKRRNMVFLQIKYFAKFSFIHINKTGGSSIEKALGVPLVHETALAFRERIGERRWNQRFSFAIVRNPWDRAVSHYHYRRMTNQTGLAEKPLPFNEWIKRVYVDRSPEYVNEEKMFLTQADWVCDAQGRIMVDYIGRFENLQASWDEICERLQREKSLLPHEKKSSRGGFRDYYDDESRAIVAQFFHRDLELFDYTFE